MNDVAIEPFVSLFTLTLQNLGFVLPLVIPLVGGVFVLAWKNKSAFYRLEHFARETAFAVPVLVIMAIFNASMTVGFADDLVFKLNITSYLNEETIQASSGFHIGIMTGHILEIRRSLDFFWYLLFFSLFWFCVFWFAAHLFIEDQEDADA